MAKKRKTRSDSGSPAKAAGAELRALLAQGESAYMQVARRYMEVRDKKEYSPDYRTAYEFMKAELSIEADAMKRLVAIANHFTDAVADQYDFSNLALFLRLAGLTNLTVPADPGPVPITFAKGPSGTLPFSQCHAKELRSAIKLARGGETPGGTVPAGDQKIIKGAQAMFESSEGGEAPATLRARVLGGRTVVTFADIDLYEVKAMMEIMSPLFPDDSTPDKAKRSRRKKLSGRRGQRK